MAIVVNTIAPPLEISVADAVWAQAVISNARNYSEDALAAAVTRAYHALRDHLVRAGARHMVRMWNYIPGITDAMPSGGDRYMAFNAGRFDAMSVWFGDVDQIVSHAPAASGVGTTGGDLIIHAMALDRPGTAVQNPLQTPAARYSPRFGPRPPCFARATRVGHTVLVSGTAAIRGEDTVAADFPGQLDVTLNNLAALPTRGLAAYRSLRAFLPDLSHQPALATRLSKVLAADCRVRYEEAALCRPDLLVEIEGIASDSRTHE